MRAIQDFNRERLARGYRRIIGRLQGPDPDRADGRCRLPPEWLVLGINNVCNLHCKMCDVGLGASDSVFWANLIGDHPQNMPLELLELILRQARAFWPRPKVGLAFTEPLIHPKVLEFAQAIVRQGYYCAITSNGSTLPRLAEALVEIGVDTITLSVDGPRGVHNRIRGGRESFEKLYHGVEVLNAARARLGRKRPEVQFSFTITDENFTHILDFVREVEPLCPARIMISQLNFITDEMASIHNAQHADLRVARSSLEVLSLAAFRAEQIWRELEAVRAYARSRGPDFPALAITPNFLDVPGLQRYYGQPLEFVGGRQCTDPWQLLMVKTDGSVNPAHGRCYNYPVGNVKETPLAALWNNERFRRFRQRLHSAGGTLPACARCCGVIGKLPADTNLSHA